MTDVSPHFDFVPYRRELVGRLAPVLDTGLEKEDLVTYMFSCPVILSTRIMTPDEVDPSRDPIPLIFFTDGTWIWNAEVAEYVKRYDMGVPSEFIKHVVRQNAVVPSVRDDLREEASRHVRGASQ